MRISSKGLLTLPQTLGGQGPWPRRSGQGRSLTVQGYRGWSPCRDVLAQGPSARSGALPDRSGSALAYSPICLVELGQVIEAGRRVGMFWPKNLLPDPERFLVERFGFGVLAHLQYSTARLLRLSRRVGMFWPKDLLPDPERFLVERFGFGVLAHRLVQPRQVIEAHAPCRDVLAQEPSAGSGALPGRAVRLWRTRPYPGTESPGY